MNLISATGSIISRDLKSARLEETERNERMVPLVTRRPLHFFPPNFYADDDVVVVFQTRHPNDGKVIMTTNMMIINPYQQTGALRPPLHADR